MNKILMVEDELSIVENAQKRLSLAGFEMLTAHDGRHGFQIAKQKMPDLIITDAIVPIMNGFELCKAIKVDQDTKSIPIIVMTEQHRMEESFMFLGIKDFLNKPIVVEELETIVRKKLNLAQTLSQQKTNVLVTGRPEVLSCCEQLLKSDHRWNGFYSYNSEAILRDAIRCTPDVILLDLLMPETTSDEMIRKLKLIPELNHTAILTYYVSTSISRDALTIQAQMIEVQYMKRATEKAGAEEYLGPFNPVTFLNLISIYRKDFRNSN